MQCKIAEFRWLSVIEACLSTCKTRSLSIVEAGKENEFKEFEDFLYLKIEERYIAMRSCRIALVERSRSLFMNVQNTVAEHSRSGQGKRI